MTNQHGQCRNVVRAFLSWVLPIPATPPYAVRPLHMHGATDYGRYHVGGWNVLAAKLVEHVWGAPRRPRRLESGQVRLVADFGAGSGGRGGQSVAQDAGRHGAATRTRSYAHCGLEVIIANNSGKYNIFRTFAKGVILSAKSRRAKRYAQRKIWNVSALERITLMKLRCGFCK